MAMTPLTGMPARTQDQSTFNTNANDFFSTKLPLFVTEANALQVDVDAKKTLAEAAATTATTKLMASARNNTLPPVRPDAESTPDPWPEPMPP